MTTMLLSLMAPTDGSNPVPVLLLQFGAIILILYFLLIRARRKHSPPPTAPPESQGRLRRPSRGGQTVPSEAPKFYKNPAVATILSFFLPGLGQMYNGEFGKGFGLMVLDAIAVAIIFSEDASAIGAIITPLVWIAGMMDANSSAKRINGQLAKQTTTGSAVGDSPPAVLGEYRKCPFCAEPIRREAIKCRYCGSTVEPDETSPGRGSLLR